MRATADSFESSAAIGLVTLGAEPGAMVRVQVAGVAPIGPATLVAGTYYYVSEEPGALADVEPRQGYLVRVGRAISETPFLVDIEPGIRQ